MNRSLSALYNPGVRDLPPLAVPRPVRTPVRAVGRQPGTRDRRAGRRRTGRLGHPLSVPAARHRQLGAGAADVRHHHPALPLGARNGDFHANASPIEVPSAISADVLGVVGLTNTVRLHPAYVRTATAATALGRKVPRYGAGPHGSGLSPQQVRSLYSAGALFAKGPRGQGRGTVSAVFELSGYTQHDITVFAHTFLGGGYTPPLRNVNVDGGPVHGTCPKHDHCFRHDFSYDIEVVADIEAQLGMAPALNRLLVYNAPNDFTGQSIAAMSTSASLPTTAPTRSAPAGASVSPASASATRGPRTSSSRRWRCRGRASPRRPATRGPSTACSTTTRMRRSRPSTIHLQPLVTSVGGTSFGTFDPAATGTVVSARARDVWNPLNACSGTASGLDGCAGSARAAVACRGSGRVRPTSSAPASTRSSPPNAVGGRPAGFAARCPTCRPTRTSSLRTPSTAQATRGRTAPA